MKSVLISIQPKWCEKICNVIGRDEKFKLIYEKTVEVRKTRPKLRTPFKVYIYCTKGEAVLKTINNSIFISKPYKVGENLYGLYKCVNGNVIGEFVCDEILDCRDVNMNDTCLTVEEWLKYTKGHKGIVYGWHISDLVIYDEPRELSEFRKPIDCHRGKDRENCIGCWDCEIKRPPQSWCYAECGG